MKKLICLIGVLLMLTLLVPVQQAGAGPGHGGPVEPRRHGGHGGPAWHGGHGWFLPGLIIGGTILGLMGLAASQNSPPPPAYPPPPPAPPASDEVGQVPPSGSQMFIYPRQGQNQAKQVTDRTECHNWAVSQVGYDPSNPPSAYLTEAQLAQKSADYYRAMGACLDARGYSMR